MERTLEQSIRLPEVAARGNAILDEMPHIIESVENSSLIPKERKSVAKFVLNQIRENPELAYIEKYASKVVNLTEKTGNYHALNARYEEIDEGIKGRKLPGEILYGKNKSEEKEVAQNKTYDKVNLDELEKTAQEIKEGYGGLN